MHGNFSFALIVIGNAVYGGHTLESVELITEYATEIGLRLTKSIDKTIFGLYNVMQKEKVLIFKKDEDSKQFRESRMRSLIIYPWLVGEFIQWLKPDVSKWAIDDVKVASSQGSDEEPIELDVILALSHYDSLRWFEDGRLVGSKNNESHEIADNLKDYRFNGLFYSGLFGTEGEPEW